MIDMHCHLVFDADDGPAVLEESVRMVKEAEAAGVRTVFSTVHRREPGLDLLRYRKNLKILEDSVSDRPVRVLPGFEVALTPEILKDVRPFKELTLGGSEYLLLEFPFSGYPLYSREAVYKLQLAGIIPILAHPERCPCFVRKPELLKEFAVEGCRIQVDAASVLGVYGNEAKSFSKQLIVSGPADFVASDAHHARGYSEWYRNAHQVIKGWIGQEKAQRLFHTEAKILLECTK